ncbi:tyrosine-protein kinase family protein [Actibacterium ureilyticum]|uniref:tyrosine-protein kinase family protein n=1 Tax=Actibacterium ureilyticum TaxID=1590614 RepID=UPI000BAADDD8|nr:CpsD/CapB family tyrosine-protein kinase [Actibacterium ureilyticum]
MEKLQAAIAQAREMRGKTGPAHVRGVVAASVKPGAWDQIAPLEISAETAAQNRLVSLAGGVHATPFDLLRTKVLQLTAANQWTRVAITSPSAGCGKTTTAANLAASLGRQVDKRTILMDMDMRRPTLGQLFGYEGRASVFDVLEEDIDFADQARRLGPNVALSMNAGPARDPSELILRKRTEEIINEIERTYQPGLMLFDLPPMLANDDTSAFLRIVDCVMIVAEAEVTTAKQIDTCEKELAQHTNILGVVLNKCRFNEEEYGYSYGY